MAFRSADFSDLCTRCRAPTELACLRCGAPLCARHQPGPSDRCDRCEREFESARAPVVDAALLKARLDQRAVRHPRTGIVLAVTSAVVLGLSFGVSTDIFFAVLLGVPMLCLGGFEIVRSFGELVYRHQLMAETTQRRRFLAERKPHMSLRS